MITPGLPCSFGIFFFFCHIFVKLSHFFPVPQPAESCLRHHFSNSSNNNNKKRWTPSSYLRRSIKCAGVWNIKILNTKHIAPIVCNPRNHEQALRQDSASVPESPACHCLAAGQSLVRGFSVPCQALAPLVPQFPWQELLLAMHPATWEVLVNTGRQRRVGVGNRWNSRARQKGWRQQSHRLCGNRRVVLFTSSFIF